MEYTVGGLCGLSGVSVRTLHHYDAIGLLRPARVSDSGYRLYGEKEVDRLQQILFLKELGLSLSEVARAMDDAGFDRLSALRAHLAALQAEDVRLHSLIDNVRKTILKEEGKITMKDSEKFEGLKKRLVEENDRQYGAEVREKYGETAADDANRKMLNMTQAQYDAMQQMGEALAALLERAVREALPAEGETGREAARLHKTWLMNTWTHYSAEAHKGLSQMYVDDERFTAFYDRQTPGCARFLRDAIYAWAEEL